MDIRGYAGWAHRLNIADLPIASENIFYEYDDATPAEVRFRLSNGNYLRLYFPERGACYLIPESGKRFPRTPTQFKADFDLAIGFVPILGPVEQHERLYEKEAARLALFSSGASRNFRNIWHHYPEGFEEFRDLVKATWPGMDIEPPELVDGGRRLAMFCPEARHPRELCWAGYGFQVWCQMLTHIVKARGASMLLIDEPDIYLHSDLQRQLVALLRELGPDILIATHSTEIIAECEPNSLLNVNKRHAGAQRVRDVSQLKRVFAALGSNINPILTQLAKTRRAVFVEGLDFQILAVFARTLGAQSVANRSEFAVVRTEGFNPGRARDLATGIEATVGGKILRAAILDRDYRATEELEQIERDLARSGFLVRIHARKELENYLIDPTVISRAVEARLDDRARRLGQARQATPDIAATIEKEAQALRRDVFAQKLARQLDYSRKHTPNIDQATVTAEVMKHFDEEWSQMEGRMALVSGKELLARVNDVLQASVGVSLSDGQIAQQFRVDEIHPDMVALIDSLAQFGRNEIGE